MLTTGKSMTGILSSLHLVIPKCHSLATPESFFLNPYKVPQQHVIISRLSSFTLSSTTCSTEHLEKGRSQTSPHPAAQGWGTPGLLPKVLRGPGTAAPAGQGPPALGHLRSGCPASWSLSSVPDAGGGLLPILVPLLPWLRSPALHPRSPSPRLPPPWSSKEGRSTAL